MGVAVAPVRLSGDLVNTGSRARRLAPVIHILDEAGQSVDVRRKDLIDEMRVLDDETLRAILIVPTA